MKRIGPLSPPPAALSPESPLHILVLVRPKTGKAGGNARVLSNIQELLDAIYNMKNVAGSNGNIPPLKVTVQDMGHLPFDKQVALAHSASIFIGMHGAGIPHIFNAAIGEPNCCSLIELFPDPSIGFSHIQGFGNIARYLGMSYYRHVASAGQSSKTGGTSITIKDVITLLRHAIVDVKEKSICLHDVRTDNALGSSVL